MIRVQPKLSLGVPEWVAGFNALANQVPPINHRAGSRPAVRRCCSSVDQRALSAVASPCGERPRWPPSQSTTRVRGTLYNPSGRGLIAGTHRRNRARQGQFALFVRPAGSGLSGPETRLFGLANVFHGVVEVQNQRCLRTRFFHQLTQPKRPVADKNQVAPPALVGGELRR